jgi:hypothetical protein
MYITTAVPTDSGSVFFSEKTGPMLFFVLPYLGLLGVG